MSPGGTVNPRLQPVALRSADQASLASGAEALDKTLCLSEIVSVEPSCNCPAGCGVRRLCTHW